MEKSLNKFWEWMKKQDKVVYCEGDLYPSYWAIKYYKKDTYNVERVYWLKPEKQMLIGYMEEYLLVEHGTGIGNRDDIYSRLNKGEKYGDIRYDQLEEEIIRQTKNKKKF
jgi:hypothetical protein